MNPIPSPESINPSIENTESSFSIAPEIQQDQQGTPEVVSSIMENIPLEQEQTNSIAQADKDESKIDTLIPNDNSPKSIEEKFTIGVEAAHGKS